MVLLLFRVSLGIGKNEPKWVWFVIAAAIAIIVGPVVSTILYYGVLDELVGPDWLGIHSNGLGAPDPLFGPRETTVYYIYGGVLGAVLAILAHYVIRKPTV